MIRRRRRGWDVTFSFDCFLDLVTNVVGVIIRLILVVWVGARSYTSLQTIPPPPEPPPQVAPAVPLDDPLQAELERQRRALAEAQARLLEQLRHFPPLEDRQVGTQRDLAALETQRRELEQQDAALDRTSGDREAAAQKVSMSLDEFRRRQQRLRDEIRAVEQLPPVKKSLRYRTPVSKPVDAEEFLFECKGGRVTFVDVGAMLAEVRRGLDDKSKLLQTRWEVTDRTEPAGAFRLRYTVERERGALDGLVASPGPGMGGFRYGLAQWEIEPVTEQRGEALAAALVPGSEFRQVVDVLDPQLAAVTFFVYPDSFALFRGLRDYLYQRDLTVAGRPLTHGTPIAASRHGSRSQGQ